MNLIQAQNDLRDLSDKQLQTQLLNPDGSVPSILVLNELQRRKTTRDNYAKQASNGTSMAEEFAKGLGSADAGKYGDAIRGTMPGASPEQQPMGQAPMQQGPIPGGVPAGPMPEGMGMGGPDEMQGYADGGAVMAPSATPAPKPDEGVSTWADYLAGKKGPMGVMAGPGVPIIGAIAEGRPFMDVMTTMSPALSLMKNLGVKFAEGGGVDGYDSGESNYTDIEADRPMMVGMPHDDGPAYATGGMVEAFADPMNFGKPRVTPMQTLSRGLAASAGASQSSLLSPDGQPGSGLPSAAPAPVAPPPMQMQPSPPMGVGPTGSADGATGGEAGGVGAGPGVSSPGVADAAAVASVGPGTGDTYARGGVVKFDGGGEVPWSDPSNWWIPNLNRGRSSLGLPQREAPQGGGLMGMGGLPSTRRPTTAPYGYGPDQYPDSWIPSNPSPPRRNPWQPTAPAGERVPMIQPHESIAADPRIQNAQVPPPVGYGDFLPPGSNQAMIEGIGGMLSGSLPNDQPPGGGAPSAANPTGTPPGSPPGRPQGAPGSRGPAGGGVPTAGGATAGPAGGGGGGSGPGGSGAGLNIGGSGLRQYMDEIRALGMPDRFGEMEARNREDRDKLDKSVEGNKGEALLTAGAAMMASQSPFAGVGIGTGALAGVKQWNDAQKEMRAAQQAIRQAENQITIARANRDEKQLESGMKLYATAKETELRLKEMASRAGIAAADRAANRDLKEKEFEAMNLDRTERRDQSRISDFGTQAKSYASIAAQAEAKLAALSANPLATTPEVAAQIAEAQKQVADNKAAADHYGSLYRDAVIQREVRLGNVKSVSSPEEAAKLPKGTRIVTPDGRLGVVK